MSQSALPPAYLGVTHSVLGRRWVLRLDEAARERATAIAQHHGLSDILARVLAGRGIGIEEAPRFLDPRLRNLMPDPSTLTDLDRAAERLADAAERRENVAIFGDYDVDGACASALLAEWLHAFGIDARIHIPDRITEGYGPNIEAIRALREAGASLLVTVDCGTASHAALQYAKEIGLTTLVLDHHLAPEILPPAEAIVNPNRQDDLSQLGHLCAAGIVFLTLVGANRVLRRRGKTSKAGGEPDLLAKLDLVALATVADVVPLVGLNRAFVRQGLAVMRQRRRIGLAALMDAARLNDAPTPYHLGFLIGPRINAGGRIGDAALGARLLLTEDAMEAKSIAAELDRLNAERQAIEVSALEEASAIADRALADDPSRPVLIVASPDWHPGIVGLLASRLKERHRRPTFALAMNGDGMGTGSGRSIPGVDLGRAVREAAEAGIIAKGGGHAMAAGITVTRDQIATLETFLAERLGAAVARAVADVSFPIDAAISARGAGTELAESIEAAGPFGSGAPEPVFALPGHRLLDAISVGTAGHIRARLQSPDGAILSAIAFRAAGQALGEALLAWRGEAIHAAGHLHVNRWGGGAKPEFRIADLAKPTR